MVPYQAHQEKVPGEECSASTQAKAAVTVSSCPQLEPTVHLNRVAFKPYFTIV
jgi:hypothetical protein